MSEKLTPEELKLYSDFLPVDELISHITAVEAERDTLAALVREFLNEGKPQFIGDYYLCEMCGTNWEHWQPEIHIPDCLITRARQALATMATI